MILQSNLSHDLTRHSMSPKNIFLAHGELFDSGSQSRALSAAAMLHVDQA